MKSFASLVSLFLLMNGATAFVGPASSIVASRVSSVLAMDIASIAETSNALSTAMTSSATLLADTEPWVQPLSLVLGPFLNFLSFAMLCRVVASWYPETNLKEVPWSIIAWPTEPFLGLVKGAIPPAFGVDITPVFWLGIFTFMNEIFLGQQGLLVMKMKYGI